MSPAPPRTADYFLIAEVITPAGPATWAPTVFLKQAGNRPVVSHSAPGEAAIIILLYMPPHMIFASSWANTPIAA